MGGDSAWFVLCSGEGSFIQQQFDLANRCIAEQVPYQNLSYTLCIKPAARNASNMKYLLYMRCM